MRVSELTGAMLDMWVGRAEGIPADQLEMRPQPMGDAICVRTWKIDDIEVQKTLAYSTSWEDGGPLIEREKIELFVNHSPLLWSGFVTRYAKGKPHYTVQMSGPTPLIAAMRAFVAIVLGEELPE